MKKIILCILTASIILSTATVPVYAATTMPEYVSDNEQPTIQNANAPNATVILFEDGSRLTVSDVYDVEEDVLTYAAASTTTKSRDVYYEDSNGNREWTYTLTATFSYVYGVSSTCTNAYYTQTIYDNK